MSEQALSKTHFDTTMARLFGLVATRSDVADLAVEVNESRIQLDRLYSSIDGFMGAQGKDHDEVVILRTRYQRLAEALVRKGVADWRELEV